MERYRRREPRAAGADQVRMTDEAEYTPPQLNDEESHFWEQMSPQARRQVQDIEMRLRPAGEALRMWESLLTAEQRAGLGGDFERAYRQRGTLGIWMHVHNLDNRFAAVVVLARSLSNRDGLLRQSGAEGIILPPPAAAKPHWDRDTFALWFRGKIVRRVKRPNKAKNIVLILSTFEDDGWAERIDDPLPGGADPVRLAAALGSLNKGLVRLRFHKDGTGKGITWTVS